MSRPRVGSSVLCAVFLVAMAAMAAGLAGCSGDSEQAVGSVALEPTDLEMVYGTYQPVKLVWSPTIPLDGSGGDSGDSSDSGDSDAPMVFVHLVDDEGRLHRTFDHALPEDWSPGREISYPFRLYQSILAPPVVAGEYRLTVGLYDGGSLRWPLEATTGEEVGGREYAVADVTVADTEGAFPGVVFSSGWSATIAGGDRQVLAVRWLTGEGNIQLTSIPEAGRLWVEFYVPWDEEGDEWVFDGEDALGAGGTGGRLPHVRVSTTCSDFTTELEGHGAQDLEVPVGAGAEGCAITFTPDFTVSSTDLDRSSLLLRNVSWRGGDQGAQ